MSDNSELPADHYYAEYYTHRCGTRVIRFFCPKCKRYHHHGTAKERTDEWVHLLAHCTEQPVPGTGTRNIPRQMYRPHRGGYWLKVQEAAS